MDDLAIGIDLGTTNSCAALYINGKLKILENSEGSRITPSFIFFTNLDGTIVGDHAKRMANVKPEYGVYEIKRLVGRKFDDLTVQNNLQYYPFKVASNNNEPTILVEHQNKIFKKTPQELCTIILQKIKKDVEVKLGRTINKVVITVPAYFNMPQREVTLAAAKAAGFTVLKLLNEPTAAALSYYFENDSDATNYCLVFDLGGGTFDVAVLKRNVSDITILSVDGDTHLGGHDFDNLIVDYVCKEIMKKYNHDLKLEKNNMRRLHNKCEEAKKVLSLVHETVIILNGLVEGHPSVQLTLTREQFENMAYDLFKKTINIVDNCIKNSKISKSVIKEVILSGGSTRIPKIQSMLSTYFDGKNLNKFVNPDECVAEGAALQAAMSTKSTSQQIDTLRMTDVTPLSLGVDVIADKMDFIINRNTPIPTNKSTTYVTVENQQSSMAFQIFEGERTDVKKNRLLGDLVIENITPAPPGQCQVIFTMTIDENGILTVTAKEKLSNNIKELKVNYTRGDRSDSEVKNALSDAENNREEDECFLKFANLKDYLLNYCVAVKYNFEEKKLTTLYKEIYEVCKSAQLSAKKMNVEDKNELTELTLKVKQQCEPIVQLYNFELMPIFDKYI